MAIVIPDAARRVLVPINGIKRAHVTIGRRASNATYENSRLDYESDQPLVARRSFGDVGCIAPCLTRTWTVQGVPVTKPAFAHL